MAPKSENLFENPKCDDTFVCGAMGYENGRRAVHTFSCDPKNQKTVHRYSLQHENLTTITSTNAFHPTRNILVGGNSSGKAYVWTERNEEEVEEEAEVKQEIKEEQE